MGLMAYGGHVCSEGPAVRRSAKRTEIALILNKAKLNIVMLKPSYALYIPLPPDAAS